MSNDNKQYDFRFGKKYPLTEKAIEITTERIYETYGLRVREVRETESGYLFIGKYGFSIGDITFDENEGRYRQFNFHEGVISRIKDRDKAEQQKKKKKQFKLQKYKKIGVALGATAIIALASVGAIKLIDNITKEPEQQVEVVQQMNTVANANDLILYSWANYAMNEVYDRAENSEVEYAQTLCDNLRNSNYNVVMLNYFNYLDQLNSGLPAEINGKDSYHTEFRNQCYLFDEALESSYFSHATFDESPYANAIVLDSNGQKITSTGLYGEVCDINGNLIVIDGDVGYTVYVRAVDVPNNDYTITNLPDDAEFIDGEAYVAEHHLDDFEITDTKSK